jgi:hypothetical protein
MIARTAGTVLLATIVFVVVSLLVSLGVLWWTGGLLSGAVSSAAGRSGERRREGSSDENEPSGDRPDR